MEEVFEQSWWGNTTNEWLIAAAIAGAVFLALWSVEWLFTRRFAKFAERSRFTFDDVVVATLRATRFWFTLAVAVWAGSLALRIGEPIDGRLEKAIQLAVVLQAALWATAAIGAWVRGYATRRAETDPSAVTTMRAVGLVGRLVVWAFGFVAVLAVFDIDIAPLLAGLGIGGVAVALATQNILGDLFASLSIVLDKPFVIGDFIVVGTEMGTVEYIGLKTTRVRSLSGEQLVFGNADLLASRVRNMKRMSERRVVFTLGVTYQTPRAKLMEIPAKLKQIVEAREHTRFDRAHFVGFGASSLDFEIVYYVKDPDYNLYRDLHQAIGMAIHEYFEGEGIEFAYPTQTVFVSPPEAAEPVAGPPTGAARRV